MIGIEGDTILLERLGKAHGLWTFTAYYGDVEYNEHGRVLNDIAWTAQLENLITTVGKGLTLDRLFGLSAAVAVSGTAVGTSATAAAVTDTAITGAVYQAFDSTPIRTSLTVTATTTYNTATANINIQEAGLLTASGGVLFNHLAPIGPFNKTTAVSLAVSTSITQS